MSFEITTDAPIPTISRNTNKAPNPFAPHFPSDEKALTVTLPLPKDDAEVLKTRRLAYEAAKACQRTARVLIQTGPNHTDKKPETVLTVWTVAQRTYNKDNKPAETPAETAK